MSDRRKDDEGHLAKRLKLESKELVKGASTPRYSASRDSGYEPQSSHAALIPQNVLQNSSQPSDGVRSYKLRDSSERKCPERLGQFKDDEQNDPDYENLDATDTADEAPDLVPDPKIPVKVIPKAKSTKKFEEPKSLGGKLEHDIKNLRGINMTLQAQKAALADEIKEMKTENKALKFQDKSRQKELKDIANENDRLRESIRILTTRQVQDVEDDDAVRSKLEGMAKACRTWARDFAIKSFYELDIEFLTKLRDEVGRTLSPAAADMRVGLFSKEMFSKGPYILLNTGLAHFIAKQFFVQPFFFLRNGLDPGAENAKVQLSLNSVLRYVEKTDNSKAHSWRSHTMQLLSTVDPQKILHLKEKACLRLAQKFRDDNWFSWSLTASRGPVVRAKREAKLLEIIKAAGDLSCSLFSRRTAMTVVSHKEFLGMPFYITSEEMKPHTTLNLDEDDRRLDGNRVALVVQPGIWAYGNERGENYKKHKVWSPSVVWISPVKNETQKTAAEETKNDTAMQSEKDARMIGVEVHRSRASMIQSILTEEGHGERQGSGQTLSLPAPACSSFLTP